MRIPQPNRRIPLRNVVCVALFSSALLGSMAADASHRSTFEPDTLDVDALALNIYHESKGLRGQNNIGWRSIAGVVFNRMKLSGFPKTLQGVIFERNKKGCGFSWYCDDLSNEPLNRELFRKVRMEARTYLVEFRRGVWRDPTNGAHSYHAVSIRPNAYFRQLRFVFSVYNGTQGHLFYA
jgi:spore germination cell wall hydrolase CwlJ-like protein